jgi:hypothetical protein
MARDTVEGIVEEFLTQKEREEAEKEARKRN